MSTWQPADLQAFGGSEEVDIASVKEDGSLTHWVTIWIVRVGDDLYIRSVRGPAGGWFRATQVCHEGRLRAGRAEADVTYLEESDAALNDAIDAAYSAKYRMYPSIVPSMQTPVVRATTLKLVPRKVPTG